MKKKNIIKLPGVIVALIQLVASIIFWRLLYQTKLIPNRFLLILGVLLLLLVIAVYFVARNSERKIWLSMGIILHIVILVTFGMSANYLLKGIKTLNEITESSVELADIGIYVRQQDAATEIADMVDYTFGIVKELDRENTDRAIAEISAMTGNNINIIEYAGLPELVSSLLVAGESDAIIMNNAFFDMISETEGYEEIKKQFREVYALQIENIVEAMPKEDSFEAFITDNPEESAFTLYISGIDSLKGLVSKSRSDVNIVATINSATRQVLLVSTPRDYYVPLSISNGIPDKLTHAGIYGINVSMETLEMLYDCDIDYYFRLNFNGFENIVDALGGLTVVSEQVFNAGIDPVYSFVQGENQLGGKEALAFARERHSFAEGDRQRGKNQMAVIEAIVDKAMSPTFLSNYSEILKSLEGSFETNVPYEVIADLVRMQLDEGGDWDIVSYSVDGTGAHKIPYSMSMNAYVMVPDYDTVDKAIEMMEQVRTGQLE